MKLNPTPDNSLAQPQEGKGPWEAHLGPLLTDEGAQDLMGGISLDDLNQRVSNGVVLRLKDDSGRTRYPAWQFDPATSEAYPVMVEIMKLFRGQGADEWEIASFCSDPCSELDEAAPRTVLGLGSGSAVVAAARRALARLYD